MKEKMNNIYNEIKTLADKDNIDGFEVYLSKSSNEEYFAKDGDIDKFSLSESIGLGIRLLKDGKMSIGFTEVLNDEHEIKAMFARAKENMAVFTKDECNGFVAGDSSECEDFYESALENITQDKLKSDVIDMEALLYKKDARVKNVIYSVAEKRVSEKYIKNSLGLSKYEKKNGILYFADVIVSDKDKVKTHYDTFQCRDLSVFNMDEWTSGIVSDCVNKLDESPLKSGKYKVVLLNKVFSELFGSFMSMFSSESVQKKLSLLDGKLNSKIASENLNIIDDPRLKSSITSRSFDGEGSPTKKYTLIENGKLSGFLYNSYTAKKEKSTDCDSA